jgi:hypothetical protein
MDIVASGLPTAGAGAGHALPPPVSHPGLDLREAYDRFAVEPQKYAKSSEYAE